ncbi:MAG: hypothetical protein E4H09_02965 [Spirochaetales bacterium]|nr:MAG: hypothetical protein E4H09_02965 [Spirochaetales bacterium]
MGTRTGTPHEARFSRPGPRIPGLLRARVVRRTCPVARLPIPVLALLVLVAAGGITQQLPDPFIVIELWTELDPMIADGGVRPVPREVAVERLVEEARVSLSGMVYGYRFVYVPGDPSRQVSEEFDLTPYGTLARGDPGFDVLQTWVDDDRLYARVSYTLTREQQLWYSGWHSSAHPRSGGVGRVPFIGGPGVKGAALADGVRMAIREHVRQLEFNRPQRSEGAALLAEGPDYGVRRGQYGALVVAFLQIDSLNPYQVY